jgi:hypothetical protein
MKIEVRHSFPAPAAACWAQFYSPEYEAAIAANNPTTQKVVLEDRNEGGRRLRRTRYKSPLPASAAAAMGRDSMSYELVERWTEGTFLIDWKVIPEMMPEKIKAEGSYSLTDAPGGCTRLIQGVVEVNIPLLGGRIEKAIGEHLTQGYEKAYTFARRWIDERCNGGGRQA